MKISVFNDPSSVDEAEFQADMRKLPEWRRERAMKYRFLIDRILCCKSYLMLLEMLEETVGTVEDNITFEYGKYGKPSIPEYPEIHFNISHCRRGIICVLNDSPVGCDIEEIPGQPDMELYESCFNEAEVRRIMNSADPCTEFAKLWTMKEAYLKFHGLGLSGNIRNLLTPEVMNTVDTETVVCKEQGYVYSVVKGGKA